MPTFEERVRLVESRLNVPLPREYVALLKNGPPIVEGAVGVPFRDEVWNVTEFLELSSAESYSQLDETYKLVSNFFPPYAVPIAYDHAGNFFCMYVAGQFAGQVHWWDHEREVGEIETEYVAPSLTSFVASIRPIPDDV